MKGFLSVSLRYLVNVESLNGVESVGNISRHRVAPVVLPVGKGYAVKYVPVVSGESIAHAYQSILVEEAMSRNLPVGKRSSIREFIKYADEGIVKDEGLTPPSKVDEMRKFEVDVMLHDVIADVGGFLYAGKTPVKRTSAFSVSYMIPAYDSDSETAALEAQFHVRMTPSNPKEGGQIPYTVEVGSAIYTLTFNIDLDHIAKPSNFGDPVQGEKDLQAQRDKRIEASVSSAMRLLENLEFGAKRSRFSPIFNLLSAVVVRTDKPFSATPGTYRDYVFDTTARAESLRNEKVLTKVKIVALNPKEQLQIPEGITVKPTISSALGEALKE